MKVAIVVAHYDAALDYLETTAARVLAKAHDVHVVTSTVRASTLSDAGHTGLHDLPVGTTPEDGVTVHRLKPLLRQGQRIISLRVTRALREIDPDLVVQVLPSQLFSVPATGFARSTRTPIVYISGENSQQGPQAGMGRRLRSAYLHTVWPLVVRRTAQHADWVVAATPETRELILGCTRGVDPVVVPLPFRSDRFRLDEQERAAGRESLGIAGERVTLFVGRCVPGKRLEDVIDAWERMAADRVGELLVIAGLGEDEYSRAVKSRVAASVLGDRVRALPFVEGAEVNRLLNVADVAVFPTVSVGIQQAMATGCLVLVPEGSTGAFLVEGAAAPLGAIYPTGADGDRASGLAAALAETDGRADSPARAARAALAFELYSDERGLERMLGTLGRT